MSPVAWAKPRRSAFSLVSILEEEVEVPQTQACASPQDLGLVLARRLPLLHLEQPVAGAVGRTVIHEDDFFTQGVLLHAAGDLFNGRPFVVNRYDDGKQRVLESRGSRAVHFDRGLRAGHGRRGIVAAGHRDVKALWALASQ